MAKCSTCPIKVVRSGHTITIRQDPDPECDHEWVALEGGQALCTKCWATLPEVKAKP
jgi:hypothetical protein